MQNRVSWYEPKIISKETTDDVEFWPNIIYIYSGYTFKPRSLTTCLVFIDAGDDGYGGFILKCSNKEVCSAKFKNCKKQKIQPIENYLPVNMSWIASEKCCETNLFKSI